MFSRLTVVSFIVGIILFTLPGGTFAEKARFAVAFRWAPPYVLVNLAIKENNFWKEQGLEVEWFDFIGGVPMHRAMAAGAIDVGIADVAGALVAILSGVPELMVARWEMAPNYSIWVAAQSRFKAPEDIKGGKIGVERLGSTTAIFGLMALRRMGLSEKDVKFIGVGGQPERVAALKSGVIDGFVQAYQTNVELIARGEIRPLINIGDHLPKEWIDGAYLARKDFVEKEPQAVMKTVKGVFQAIDFVRANRSWAATQLVSHLRLSPAGARLAVDEKILFPRLGQKISRKALTNVINSLLEYGVIKKERLLPLDKILYPNEFTASD